MASNMIGLYFINYLLTKNKEVKMPNDQKNQGSQGDKSKGMQDDKNKGGSKGSVPNHHPVPAIQVPAPVLLPVTRETAEVINNEPLHYYEKVLKKLSTFFINISISKIEL